MIRGNIHPQPSGRNSLGEEIKNSHPEPGPLMAGIVHVNMGHCPYYHITFRRAPRPYTRPGIAYKYQQLQNRGWFVRSSSLLVRLSGARWKLDYIWEAVNLPSLQSH